MPVCAVSGSSGIELQQMSSTADACSGVVLLQPDDVPPNPFYMDMQTGAEVAGAVAAVWLTGWGIRMAINALRDNSTDGAT
ncbi:MAG: hypothetical protein JOY60_17805 [Burkholderiaceae bacterium]|nr:hypothetical protein [Burkholderiaceae bacterium]